MEKKQNEEILINEKTVNDNSEMKKEDTKDEIEKNKEADVQKETVVQEEKDSDIKETEVRSKKGRRMVCVLISVFLIVLATVYFGISLFYRYHFFPYTKIDEILCSNMSVESVIPMIDAQVHKYSLTVTGRNYQTEESGEILGVINVEDIELTYKDTKDAVQAVMDSQNEFLWPMIYFKKISNSYSLSMGILFNEEKLRETIESWESCKKENMLCPEDAYISGYNERIKGYEIIPETVGTELDMGKVLESIEAKLHTHETLIDLEDAGCYTEANVRHDNEKLNSAVETANSWLKTDITYDWNGNEVILDADTLKEWIRIQPGEVTLDEEAVSQFVKEQARKFDTYGKSKSFRTTLGIELKLNSPNYGWKTDTETETEELIQLIYQGAKSQKEPVYSIKAKNKGINDVGNSYIEADLTHQHLYVYQNGEIVFETDVVSGKMNSSPGSVTPAGIFGLTYKTTNAVLRGSDYETPVSYWMPFYGNYGMHDATWRVNFGGTIYLEHGSHGCINLPLDSAATIYGYVSTGFPIVCYYYEVDPLTVPIVTETLTEEELLSQHEPTLSGSEG